MTHGLAWLMLRCIMTTSSETVSQFFQFVGLTIFWFKNWRSFLNISKQLKEVSRLRFKLLGLLWPGWLRICRDVCPDDNHGSFLGILNKIASSVKCNQPRCCSPLHSCIANTCVCVPVPPPPPPPPPPPEPEVVPEPHRRSSSMRVTGTTYRSSVRGRSSDDLVIGTHLGMGTELYCLCHHQQQH